MIPMLTLGVPGDGATAILMGAFMIHGMVPGPMLFKEQGNILYAIMLGLIVVNVFMYLIGRVIDSLIIGVLCYIILLVFNFDYALLIAVVVGITNVIPFFGPFLGAIPSGFILLMINPTECFWFVIIIVLLQQLDGNVIGPKVIGDKIGISGFWILFSVIVGSGLFGVDNNKKGVTIKPVGDYGFPIDVYLDDFKKNLTKADNRSTK